MIALTRRSFTVGLLLPLASALPPQEGASNPRTIDDFFREFTGDWVRADPDLATRTRFLTGDEQDRLEQRLSPWTRAWRNERIQRAKLGLAELSRFDRTKLTETRRVSGDLMSWQLQAVVDEEPYLDYSFPLNQFWGANVALVNALVVVHPLITAKDAENYVTALEQVSTRMDEAVDEMRRIAARGISAPTFILEVTIRQIRSFVESPAGQNPLVAVLAQKMRGIQSTTDEKREQLRAQAERIVSLQVYPAYQRAKALLESQLPRSTNDAGIWRLNGGPEAYAYFLRQSTTTNMTPDQIHELGLAQVQMIERRMNEILVRSGRTEGTVKERIEKLRADLTYPNPTSDASREQILRDIEVILRDAQDRAAALFDKRPKASLVVQPFPKFQESNAAPMAVPPDDTRPGVFLFPRSPQWMNKFLLRTITYHEAVPGHFFQGGLQLENKDLPRFRQLQVFGFIGACGEGWALYAERLAAESGWYDGDPEGLLGELSSQLSRARRLVVDTGIHAKRWTRQQAIEYGISPSEVERYAVWPGQACSYLIGELKIIRLREDVKSALGEKFSLKEFHNVVLDTGIVPLDILERQIGAYIRSKGARL